MNNYPFEKIRWDERTKIIAKYIAPHSSIIDLGAGKENLSRFLVKPTAYHPVDKFKCTDHTILANFNDNEFPEINKCDYVIVQGLIEYLDDAKHFLESIKKYSDTMVISYLERIGRMGEPRKNCFEISVFKTILLESGWQIEEEVEFAKQHFIFVCKQ